jgi:outer membrane protein insertion porin family
MTTPRRGGLAEGASPRGASAWTHLRSWSTSAPLAHVGAHRLVRSFALCFAAFFAVVVSPGAWLASPVRSSDQGVEPAPWRWAGWWVLRVAEAQAQAAAGDDLDLGPELEPSEAEQVRGQIVKQITVAGNKRIAVEEIAGYLQATKIGKAFTPEGLARDVRELWDSGFFDDIEVDLKKRDDGIGLRFVLRERPLVKTIEFVGNERVDSEALTEALSVEVKTATVLSYASIRRGVQKLRDKYAEEGYFLAEVTYEVVPQKDNEVTLRFKVKEHDPVGIRRITFVGNQSISDDELRSVMITGQTSIFDFFGSGAAFRQDAFERDILVLNALYYDRGFLSVQIATPRVMLTPDRTGLELTITITEGPRYKIRRIAVFEVDPDGNETEPLEGRRKLREMLRARPGDYFNRAELAKDLGSVQTLYRDAGFANVEANPETEIDPDSQEVDIVVAIKRNKPIKFGRIEIRGNTKTRDKVIRREMEIAERQLFSESKLERSRRRIMMLGFFERVDISTEQGDDEGTVDVNVDIGEKPTGTFQLGAGFSSIENFILTGQVQQQNLLGSGQAFYLQAQISGIRQLIDFRLFEPYLLDSQFSASINLYNQLRVFNQFSQTSLGGQLGFGYPLINPELRLALNYTLESNEISNSTTSTLFGTAQSVQVFRKLPLANLFNDGITSSLKPTITFDTRNNQMFPSSGIFLQGSAELAPDIFGTDNPFYRLRYTGRFYLPINASGSVVLKANTEAGFVASPTAEGVPIFARFFMGGIFDLRGFQLRSIGPRLPLRDALDENSVQIRDGANIGGNLYYQQNIEFEFPILEAVNIRGVAFTDLGNAWNLEDLYCKAAPASPYAETDPCFTPERLLAVRTSWGFGIRWISPLGPLRFEWGFPFLPLPYEQSSDFQFTIGNFF